MPPVVRNTEDTQVRFEPARWGWLALGGVLFALGAIGLVVPLMPTTIFWILAALCFGRSSPALRDRIYAHPRVGRTIENFLRYGVLSRRSKRVATIGVLSGYAVLIVFTAHSWQILAGVGALFAAVLTYVWTRPTARRAGSP